jgi:adenine-specific DNA-methyltransferase
MARRGRPVESEKGKVRDYRHDEAKRKNNPEVGLANWEPKVKAPPKVKYQYDPFLDPQLQWAGKAERLSFEVDTVSLHIHERVSTQAIIKAVKKNGERRKAQQLGLFADPQLPLDQAVEFYQHDVDWANRLILGDSLLVMNSLLQRELMAGRVQMIYVDPPYGVAYNSNFQPSTRQRDVKDGQDDSLTREPEQIKAYRDTWRLGIHSYLTYLRDRLLLCRELLSETGSIFVQIGERMFTWCAAYSMKRLAARTLCLQSILERLEGTATRPSGLRWIRCCGTANLENI